MRHSWSPRSCSAVPFLSLQNFQYLQPLKKLSSEGDENQTSHRPTQKQAGCFSLQQHECVFDRVCSAAKTRDAGVQKDQMLLRRSFVFLSSLKATPKWQRSDAHAPDVFVGAAHAHGDGGEARRARRSAKIRRRARRCERRRRRWSPLNSLLFPDEMVCGFRLADGSGRRLCCLAMSHSSLHPSARTLETKRFGNVWWPFRLPTSRRFQASIRSSSCFTIIYHSTGRHSALEVEVAGRFCPRRFHSFRLRRSRGALDTLPPPSPPLPLPHTSLPVTFHPSFMAAQRRSGE